MLRFCYFTVAFALLSFSAVSQEPDASIDKSIGSSLVFEVKDQLIRAEMDLEMLNYQSGNRHLREAAALVLLQADSSSSEFTPELRAGAMQLAQLARDVVGGKTRYEDDLRKISQRVLYSLAQSYHREFVMAASSTDLPVAGEYLVGAALSLKGAMLWSGQLLPDADADVVDKVILTGYGLQKGEPWTAQQTNLAINTFKAVLDRSRCRLLHC